MRRGAATAVPSGGRKEEGGGGQSRESPSRPAVTAVIKPLASASARSSLSILSRCIASEGGGLASDRTERRTRGGKGGKTGNHKGEHFQKEYLFCSRTTACLSERLTSRQCGRTLWNGDVTMRLWHKVSEPKQWDEEKEAEICSPICGLDP